MDTTTPNTDQRKIIAKLRALMAKTTDNGCTEAEAMAAAELAASLMAKYDLSLDDVALGASRCAQETMRAERPGHPLSRCLKAIAELCDCKVWKNTGWRTTVQHDLFGGVTSSRGVEEETYIFFGLPHDVEIARYLATICLGAMNRAAVEFRANRLGGKPATKAEKAEFAASLDAFLCGMASSMSVSIRALKWKQRQEAAAANPGRDLVALKQAIVRRDFAALGIELSRGCRGGIGGGAAFAAGAKAGEAVRFHQGVGGRPTGSAFRLTVG